MAGGNAQTRVPSMSDYLTAGVNAIHGSDPLSTGVTGVAISAAQAAQALMGARSVAPSVPTQPAPVAAPAAAPGLGDFLSAMQAGGGGGAGDNAAAEVGAGTPGVGAAMARALAPKAAPAVPVQSTQDRIAAATAAAAAGAAKAPYELQSSNDLLGGAVHDVLSNNKTIPISAMTALAGLLPGYSHPIDPKIIAGQRALGMSDAYYLPLIQAAQAKGDAASASDLQKQYLDRIQQIQGTNPQAEAVGEIVNQGRAG